MTVAGWAQIVLFLVVLTALTPLIGGYMARVYGGEPVVLDRVLGPVERGFYRLLGTRPEPSRTGAATRARCSLQRRLVWSCSTDPADAVDPPVEPAGLQRRRRGTSRSTPPRRS